MIPTPVNRASRPLRNLLRNPRCSVDLTGWGIAGSSGTRTLARFPTGGPDGSSFARVTWTVSETINTTVLPDLLSVSSSTPWGGQVIGAASPVTPGQRYFLSIGVRPSRAMPLAIQAQGITGSTGSSMASIPTSGRGPSITCPANVWTQLTITVVPAVGCAAIRFDLDYGDDGTHATTVTAGDTLDVSEGLLVEGYDPGYYADGDTPGWKWTGATGGSVSVGYPYTLESIAGRPLGSNLTATAVSGQNAFVGVPDLPPLQGRTLYSVYDVVDTSTAYVSPVLYRESTASTATYGRVVFQAGNASVDAFGSRVDLAGGSSNATLTRTNLGARAVGRHVASVVLTEGLTAQFLRIDGFTTTTVGLTPGSGLIFPAGTAQLAHLGTPSTPAVATYLYDREHNEQTARRVMAWLARRYGAAVPAGY